jgi:hypothetical protein
MCLRTAGPSARCRSMAVRRGDERALRRRGLSLGHPRHLHVPQAGHRVAGGGQVGAEEPQLGVVMGVQRGVGAGEEGQLRARGDGLSVGRVPRNAARGEAATAAAGRVGCAATVSRPPGPGLDTGLAALLDHRDGRCCPNGVRRAEFLAERAPGAFRGTRRKGRRLPIPRAGNQQIEISSTPPTCGWRAVPGSRRRWSRTSRGLPRVSTRSRRPRACGGGPVGARIRHVEFSGCGSPRNRIPRRTCCPDHQHGPTSHDHSFPPGPDLGQRRAKDTAAQTPIDPGSRRRHEWAPAGRGTAGARVRGVRNAGGHRRRNASLIFSPAGFRLLFI